MARDRSFESLYGRYLYTDFCDGKLRSARLREGGADDDGETGLTVPWTVSFGEDSRGRIDAVTFFTGRVYRLAPR